MDVRRGVVVTAMIGMLVSMAAGQSGKRPAGRQLQRRLAVRQGRSRPGPRSRTSMTRRGRPSVCRTTGPSRGPSTPARTATPASCPGAARAGTEDVHAERLEAGGRGQRLSPARVYFDFDGVMAFPKVYVNGQLAGAVGLRLYVLPRRCHALREVRPDQYDRGPRGHAQPRHPVVPRRGDLPQGDDDDLQPGARGPLGHVCDHARGQRHRGHGPRALDRRESPRRRVAGHCQDRAARSGRQARRPRRAGTKTCRPGARATWSRRSPSPIRKRWDIDQPKLYTVRTILSVGGKVVDTDTTSFGIRTFQFTANDGFHLNGRRVQLYGVCLHHDQGPLGGAFYPRAMERQLEIMRDMGVNAIRTSHNPPAPELLDLCDRMGFVVWDEAFDKWDGTADRVKGEPPLEPVRREAASQLRHAGPQSPLDRRLVGRQRDGRRGPGRRDARAREIHERFRPQVRPDPPGRHGAATFPAWRSSRTSTPWT